MQPICRGIMVKKKWTGVAGFPFTSALLISLSFDGKFTLSISFSHRGYCPVPNISQQVVSVGPTPERRNITLSLPWLRGARGWFIDRCTRTTPLTSAASPMVRPCGTPHTVNYCLSANWPNSPALTPLIPIGRKPLRFMTRMRRAERFTVSSVQRSLSTWHSTLKGHN